MLDEIEQKITIDSFWNSVPNVNRDDVESWKNENWPNPDHPFLITSYAEDLVAFRNRVHPKLVEAYVNLYGTDELVGTIDVYGIKRPTIGHPDWRLKPLKLHWDVDVSEYVTERRPRYQALCALNEHNKSVGCFAYVPESARNLKDWFSKYGKYLRNKYVPNPNPMQQQVTPLPMRAGSVVIWDMGVAHSNTSNFSTNPRLTQFCRMIPNTEWALSSEKQALSHWWKQHPEKQAHLRQQYGWSAQEKRLLSL
jgi:hypothetical protein